MSTRKFELVYTKIWINCITKKSYK